MEVRLLSPRPSFETWPNLLMALASEARGCWLKSSRLDHVTSSSANGKPPDSQSGNAGPIPAEDTGS